MCRVIAIEVRCKAVWPGAEVLDGAPLKPVHWKPEAYAETPVVLVVARGERPNLVRHAVDCCMQHLVNVRGYA